MGKKPLLHNTLRRNWGFLREDACVGESGFVNHVSLVLRISLFQGVSRPPLRRADLSQNGEEGDWHARIAD
jgi:hypothetical protein